ncbi:hypothetical protein SDJN02_26058, partial [Cucurbita argyrosperma subsp. argyrosperma]
MSSLALTNPKNTKSKLPKPTFFDLRRGTQLHPISHFRSSHSHTLFGLSSQFSEEFFFIHNGSSDFPWKFYTLFLGSTNNNKNFNERVSRSKAKENWWSGVS